MVKSYPIRLHFIFHEDSDLPPCQAGVSVSKRHFKRAVDRNKIKRKIREAYRLNKHDFVYSLKKEGKRVAIMMIFSGKEMPHFTEIDLSVKRGLKKIKF